MSSALLLFSCEASVIVLVHLVLCWWSASAWGVMDGPDGKLLCCWHSVSLDHLGWYSHISAAFLANFPSDFEDISSVFEVLQFSRSLWDEELKLRHWLWLLLWLLVMGLFAALCSYHVWWRKILSKHCLNPLEKHRNGSLLSLVHDVKMLLPHNWTLRVKSLFWWGCHVRDIDAYTWRIFAKLNFIE